MLLVLAMTITELFAATSRNLSTVPASMSDVQQQILVQSVNAGLAEFVEFLPAHRRAEPRVERLALPVTKNITVTAGSKDFTVGTWADQSDFVGRTVLVGSDATFYNRLAAVNTLLHPYEGGGSGSTTLEVKSDAVLIGSLQEIDGDVLLSWQSASSVLRFGIPAHMHADDVLRNEAGLPTHWWVEPLSGITGGATPQFVLRVWPQPDAVYHLKFNLRLWPTAFTTSDLAATTVLPVLQREELDLVALCERGLIGSQLWLGSADKDEARTRYAEAATRLDRAKPKPGHTQATLCRTKKGF